MPVIESQKIPVSALQIGMYVSGIDRAWAETPFPLQGFHVESRDQVEQVKRYCKFVFIDISRSRARIDPRLIQDAQPNPLERFSARREPAREILNARLRPLQTTRPYAISAPARQELKQARKIHQRLQTQISQVLANMVDDGKLPIDQLRPLAGDLVESVIRNPNAFAYLAQMEGHSRNLMHYCIRVATWAILAARHLDIKRDALYDLSVAALLCKIGYTTLPVTVLEIGGAASPEVAEMLQQSLLTGIEMLQTGTDFSSRVAKAVAHHLERFDGSGFPQGLKDREIPFLAQLLGLADFYENLISYDFREQAYSSADALRELNASADVLFDRYLVEEFIQAIGLYPTGSVVRLNGQRTAIVIEQTPNARLRPKVLVLEARLPWNFFRKRIIDLSVSENDSIEASLPALRPDDVHRKKSYFRRVFQTR